MGENIIYRVNVKNMTLENYTKLYNEVFYPKNYPYHLRVGLRGEPNRVSMILQIGEPVETSDEFDIDEPTLYKFHDVLTVFGNTDEEVINAFNRIELSDNIKEAFQKYGINNMEDFSKEAKKVAADYWHTNDLSPYLSNKDKEEYNREPVYWCATCKSLMIVNFESELDTEIECYCGKCGSTEIIKGSIQEWENLINKQNN